MHHPVEFHHTLTMLLPLSYMVMSTLSLTPVMLQARICNLFTGASHKRSAEHASDAERSKEGSQRLPEMEEYCHLMFQ